MKYILASSFIFLAAGPVASFAQDPGIAEPQGANSVELVNTTNSSLNYSIRAPRGIWADYSIESGKSDTIGCATCRGGVIEFAIDTDGTILDLQLTLGERYALFWNDDRQLWDLYQMAPGQ